jgi:uroporphyrinogen-III synthase
MLVTRPEPDASDTAARLGALGIEAVLAPLLIHETLPSVLPEPGQVAALAITSANALRALEARGDIERYRHLPVYTVGDRTADMAEDLGFVMVTSASGAFADLAEVLAHARIDGPILYPCGHEVSADLGRSLAAFGREVMAVPVYAMNAVPRLHEQVAEALVDNSIGAALFYSKRTAEAFVRVTEGLLERRNRMLLGVLCLSEAVAAPLVDAHFVRVSLAERPDDEAMMGLALSFARDENP